MIICELYIAYKGSSLVLSTTVLLLAVSVLAFAFTTKGSCKPGDVGNVLTLPSIGAT